MVQPATAGGLAKNPLSEDYANDIFLMAMGLVLWAFSAVVHMLYGERYVANGRAVQGRVEGEVVRREGN